MGVADEKLQPLLPGQLPTELLVLCHACCDFDPDMRPGFATLVEELEGAVATLQVRFQSVRRLLGSCSSEPLSQGGCRTSGLHLL